MITLINGRLKPVFILLVLSALTLAIFGCAEATAGSSQVFEADVTTGVNRLNGQTMFEFSFMPEPFKDGFGFEMLGVYNEAGPEPLRLTDATPDTAVLATFVDAGGVGPPQAVMEKFDPGLANVPLRDVQTFVLPPNMQKRAALPVRELPSRLPNCRSPAPIYPPSPSELIEKSDITHAFIPVPVLPP